MLVVLTGMGLSAAAGLNAYIPFVVVAFAARFTDIITLPASLTWIESGWAIGIGSVLLLAEIVLDKIPAVDTINDAADLHQAEHGRADGRATSAAEKADESTWMADNPWVGVVLGVVVSGLVHAGATVRPAVDAGTLGMGTPVVSTAEDSRRSVSASSRSSCRSSSSRRSSCSRSSSSYGACHAPVAAPWSSSQWPGRPGQL